VNENGRIDLNIYLWKGLHLIELDDILQGKWKVKAVKSKKWTLPLFTYRFLLSTYNYLQ
jgi:hypothetical protein